MSATASVRRAVADTGSATAIEEDGDIPAFICVEELQKVRLTTGTDDDHRDFGIFAHIHVGLSRLFSLLCAGWRECSRYCKAEGLWPFNDRAHSVNTIQAPPRHKGHLRRKAGENHGVCTVMMTVSQRLMREGLIVLSNRLCATA